MQNGKLRHSPFLNNANINTPFILYTIANQIHVGVVLMQQDDESQERVITYFSKKLKPIETRYSAIDREVLGIVLACIQFPTRNFL